MMTPEEIDALFQRPSGGSDDAGLDSLTDEESAYRRAKLQEVLLWSQEAWLSGSEDINLIAQKLGDGSREGE